MEGRRIESWDHALQAVSDWNSRYYIATSRRLAKVRALYPEVAFGFAYGDLNFTLWLSDVLLDVEVKTSGHLRYSVVRIGDLAAVQVGADFTMENVPTNVKLEVLHQPSGNQWYWDGTEPKSAALILEFSDRLISSIGD